MRLPRIRAIYRYLWSTAVLLLLSLSCSKDRDLLLDTVLENDVTTVDQDDGTAVPSEDEPADLNEDGSMEVEGRTTVFPVINDAYLESGKGYNQPIVRLEENRRTSYLMFDLSQIASIGGNITSASLEFVVDIDGGGGKIEIFKGASADWTENNLSESSSPEIEVLLGSIAQEYEIDAKIGIALNADHLLPEPLTLILIHKDGDDLAFASKEHKTKVGGELVVTYDAPKTSEEIVAEKPQDNDEINEGSNEEQPTEETPTEEAPEEEPPTEEPPTEEPPTEEAPEEETPTEEPPAEEPPTEEAPEEETPTEEPPAEEPPTEETPKKEPNTPPIASADASPSSGVLPLRVTFTGDSSSDDKAIASYQWSFKDGSTATTANAVHTFTKEGSYDVALKVTDAEGLNSTDSVIITVTVKSNEAPAAKVGADVLSGTTPLAVNFTGSNSTDDKAVTSYLWDFKDGSSSSQPNPSHTFNTPGTYTVALTVQDESGLKDTERVTITVSSPQNKAPKAVATANTLVGNAPLQLNFIGSNSTDDKAVTGYSWNFKDGSTAASANVTHTFTTAGSYDVTLKVTDAEGLNSTDTVTITVNAKSNEAPIAKVSANVRSGATPLVVDFTGSNSTDDNAVTSYSWDFKDGSSSNQANPSHTFNTPGTYTVALTVQDESGLKDTETVTVTVNPPQNEAPKAVAAANILTGDAPLQVNFTGSNSSDDKGIVNYNWDLPGNPSSAPNTAHTFDNPGVYTITLTVTDEEGLMDTANLTITVTQPSAPPAGCSTDGGKAGDTGFKSWCWGDVTIPDYSGRQGVGFSQGELYVDSECYEKQVTKVGDQIKFRVNPTSPNVPNWCSRDFNMRAEIRTAPWDIRHAKGTEEWFGWSYTFGNDYVIDQKNQWKFFQVHNGIAGQSPQIGLEVIHGDQFIGHSAGEVYVTNGTSSRDFIPTGITPNAGQTLDIVVHAIWEDASKGLLQVWINGNKVYDEQVSTVYSAYPWGGNAKWGIYKWPWSRANEVQESQQQGITHLETSMGALRIITRRPGDVNYGKNSYSEVVPR